MTDELQLPPYRRSDPNDLLRQGTAMAGLVQGLPARSRLKRWLVSIGVGGVVVATAGAGIAYLSAESATTHTGVFCFTGPSTSKSDRGTSTNYNGQPSDAVAQCAALWDAGILRVDSADPVLSSAAPATSVQPVPALVACVYQHEAAVFPGGSDLCQQLGLPPLAQ